MHLPLWQVIEVAVVIEVAAVVAEVAVVGKRRYAWRFAEDRIVCFAPSFFFIMCIQNAFL